MTIKETIVGVVVFIILSIMTFTAVNTYKFEPYINTDSITCQNTIDSIRLYINKTAPDSKVDAKNVYNLCKKYGIDWKFVCAQAHLESHFGTRGVGARYNNVFNICAYDYDLNRSVKFSNPNDSFEYYLKLLTNMYLSDGRTTDDLLNNYTNIRGERYASNPNYESDLKTLISNMN